ncbi:MAG TPA: hypothetical protein VLG16_03995 [Candidatus Saccharimonadales bacterium]|nr:hypothetical protein [Candidatus Saccharimonadales bacterium]
MSEQFYEGPEIATSDELRAAYDTAVPWLKKHAEKIKFNTGEVSYLFNALYDTIKQYAPDAIEQLGILPGDNISIDFLPAIKGGKETHLPELSSVLGAELRVEVAAEVTTEEGIREGYRTYYLRPPGVESDLYSAEMRESDDTMGSNLYPNEQRDALTRAETAALQQLFDNLDQFEMTNAAKYLSAMEVVTLQDLGFN